MSHYYKFRDWIPLEKLNWWGLSKNSAAIHLLSEALEQKPNKIHWNYLSANPAAIHLLEQNPDKINWIWLSKNPKAIHILEQNLDKIYWFWLSKNPAIFTYDYKKIAEHRWPINKEIIQNRFHPKNMKYFSGWGIEEFDDYEE